MKLVIWTSLFIVLLAGARWMWNKPSVKNYIEEVSGSELDSMEFGPGFKTVNVSALEQLQYFPAAQFKENHGLLPNFLWMDPSYLSGLLQPNLKLKTIVPLSVLMQKELAFNWNYYFLVSNNLKAYRQYNDTNTFWGAWVKYANLHPEIPTAAISFWGQVQPNKKGGDCSNKYAYVINKSLPDSCYISDKNGVLLEKKKPSPIKPLSALHCDFITQEMYVDSLLRKMIRPLNMINENGEVFTVYDDEILKADARIVKDKNNYPNLNWREYQAQKRLEKELAFRNSFMQKPELQNCIYTEYAIDGQNKYRHDYKTIRAANSKINKQYYSTPDFYPRYPYNWKDWQGPWHGLKWIEICRNTEIAVGDNLFSPFVAAGWDSTEANNIRPAQWLGLLKVLSVMGAEFYYSGFFNVGKQVAKPENYVWQAVMPVYAQGVTSYFEDILRNGILLNAPNYIQYPESDVPVVIRKHKNKKQYVIACTWQTGTNKNKGTALSKNISIEIDGKTLTIEARRQGSVYYYSAETNTVLFYQLDAWHQYEHPYRWSQNISIEPELTNSVTSFTFKNEKNNYTKCTSAVQLKSTAFCSYTKRNVYFKNMDILLLSNKNEKLTVRVDDKEDFTIQVAANKDWKVYSLKIYTNSRANFPGRHNISLSSANKEMLIDKIVLKE